MSKLTDDNYKEQTKKRSLNWTEEEISLLVDLVSSSSSIITGKLSRTLRRSDKEEFWRSATEQINAVGGRGRSKDQVYKKWADLKRYAKKEESSNRRSQNKTGGGPCHKQPVNALHEKIIGTIPGCCIVGIADKGDSNTTVTEDRTNLLDRTDDERYFAHAIDNLLNESASQTNSLEKCKAKTDTNRKMKKGRVLTFIQACARFSDYVLLSFNLFLSHIILLFIMCGTPQKHYWVQADSKSVTYG